MKKVRLRIVILDNTVSHYWTIMDACEDYIYHREDGPAFYNFRYSHYYWKGYRLYYCTWKSLGGQDANC